MDSIQWGADVENTTSFHVMPCQLSSTLKAADFTGTFQYMAPEVLKQEPQQRILATVGWIASEFFIVLVSKIFTPSLQPWLKYIKTFRGVSTSYKKLQAKKSWSKGYFVWLEALEPLLSNGFHVEFSSVQSSFSNFDPSVHLGFKCCVLVFDLEMTGHV